MTGVERAECALSTAVLVSSGFQRVVGKIVSCARAACGCRGAPPFNCATNLGTYSDQDRHAGKGVVVRGAEASDDREKDAMSRSQLAYQAR